MYPESLYSNVFGSNFTYGGIEAKVPTPAPVKIDSVAIQKLKEVPDLMVTPGTNLFDYYLDMLNL